MKNHKKNRRQRIAEKAARLAPAEVQAGQPSVASSGATSVSEVAGTRAPTTAPLRETQGEPVRKTVLDEEYDEHKWFGCRPVLVVILGLSLAFIAMIAYLISQQP